jgi:uncharacterized membrane protein
MKILILYSLTAVIFFAADALGLRLLIKPVFERHISHLFADPFRAIPAVVFYLGYLVGGAVLGLMAYGTYEFTNYATLRDWSFEQVAVDTIWGGVLTGFSAWSGVVIARAIG